MRQGKNIENYEDFREQKNHGEADFPFNIYSCVIPDTLPEVFTHWHDEVEIIYLEKGRGIVTVDLESRVLQAPALVFILPGQLHAIRPVGRSRMEYQNILFLPDLLYAKQADISEVVYLRPLFDGEIRIPTYLEGRSELFELLEENVLTCERALEERMTGYSLLVKSQLYLLCFQLVHHLPETDQKHVRSSAIDQIRPILRMIMNRYAEDIRVCEAAELVGFSEAHFMRFFKKNMGVSFVTYLRDFRMSKAEVLLRTTELSVLAVAQETGFRNLSYFIRNFKEKYGYTPLQYRKEKTAE